ncbi:Myb-like DNA-binding domain containing protein [Trichomonas vaginalis G3]|uniref:Myb-like DNA-binding domain containing protein n=1 Tax=Trichomonas vaginalis (strain ATCC PRA-98 / G3) TaxID=412133 RepID=A2E4G7_TRIV3|nr:RNA polymerase II transcription regulator recruiting protein [Trichomonas vaginalis G3]EAY12502.1 Myb-like DNA-binding domain containing protein [Trichomonas vaginalis G3]KAI5539569.1 RNA polymerase II transcription regulator recruiting protein [Trichomonas vaginalis G3]|eukprot:XP_001324725.1 Myb-like DNA-binding domain containing protein [Trichomonas vaginalis G3]
MHLNYVYGIGYFHRLHPKSKFSVEEDVKLKKIVEELGSTNWNLVANKMQTRNARQCRDRWENYLSPTLNRDPFTLEEDLIILQKYNEFGAKWVNISKFLVNRTDISVKSRWMMLKRRNITAESVQEAIEKEAAGQEKALEEEHRDRQENIDEVITRLFEMSEMEESTFWENLLSESTIPFEM